MDDLQVIDLYGDWSDPVRQLLLIGEAGSSNVAAWPDYPASFGLDQQHVGALIRMACDAKLHDGESNSSGVWGPVHAWRALGQLRAVGSVQPLLALMKTRDDDDWADIEIPEVFGMIGPGAIPPIAGFVSDRESPTRAVASAISGLREIAARHPECRDQCIDILVRRLESHPDTDREINGFAVSALIDLHAIESIDAIRDAFLRNDVDLSIAGDIEDVEIELGLRDKRATPAPRYAILPAVGGGWQTSTHIGTDIHMSTGQRKIGRNQQCPCGSGKKYKKCCLK